MFNFRILGGMLILVAGCQQHVPTPPATNASGSSAVSTRSSAAPAANQHGVAKPSAPITLQLTKSADGTSVVLTATAAIALQAVELRIGQKNMQRVDMDKGETRTFTALLADAGVGNEVIGTASMMVNGRRVGKATSMQTGTVVAAPAPASTITLPDGTVVREAK